VPTPRPPFPESLKTPIRDLGLKIEGTELEPIIREFEAELQAKGIRVRPRFYLSTEWGVPFGTIAMALPFYLARPDLTELHAEKVGHVEGLSKADILRYLRHEMGHVINYAYRLYDREDWVQLFGAITQPYLEDYRPSPFSRRYVRHLPGWYAQKHPDEDWSETFAVWMTPGRDWRAEYQGWPTAVTKLEYCDRIMKDLSQRDPPTVATETDEDVRDLPYSLEQFYERINRDGDSMPHGLAGALRAIFETIGEQAPDANGVTRRPASVLIRKMERELTDNVFRWTGHFPERSRVLVRHLAGLGDQLGLVYPENQEREAALAVTTLVTALAMNHVHTGGYMP
jgi:hypothetical protein